MQEGKVRGFGVILFLVTIVALPDSAALADESDSERAGSSGMLAESSQAPGETALSSEAELETTAQSEAWDTPFSIGYFGVFYGPSLENPTSFQPKADGSPDPDRPLLLRNYLTLAYAFDSELAVSGTAYWHHEPVHGQELRIRDPYARISHNNIMNLEAVNWYGDLRAHFPVTEESRDQDLLTGIETYHTLTRWIPDTSVRLSIDGSARVNVFGSQGRGDDLELYLAPGTGLQLSENFMLTLLYEMGASHRYGTEAFQLNNDGTGLQPGFSWNVLPNLNISPYLNLQTGAGVTLASTSVGMTLSWIML